MSEITSARCPAAGPTCVIVEERRAQHCKFRDHVPDSTCLLLWPAGSGLELLPVLSLWVQPGRAALRGCSRLTWERKGLAFPLSPHLHHGRACFLRLAGCHWWNRERRSETTRLDSVTGRKQSAEKWATGTFTQH